MGNQRFKLSDMMPNAWFYKLRDMSKVKVGISNKKKKNMEMQMNPNTRASERRCPSKKRKTVYMPSPRDIIIDLPPPPPPISRNSFSAAAGVKIRRRRRRNAHHDEEKKTAPAAFYSESFALVKASFDPEKDFKDSMMEIIADNNITASKDLEDLLACYLSLNSNQYHHIIINAFHQIWFTIFTNS